MTDFEALLLRFSYAATANDGAGFSALFTADGVYDDGFFGEYAGREAIARMLQHFHDTGSNYRWDFFDPVSDARADRPGVFHRDRDPRERRPARRSGKDQSGDAEARPGAGGDAGEQRAANDVTD